MKLTNLQVLNAGQALGMLSQKKMTIKAAWKITTALRSLDPFAKAAEESIQELRSKYAVKNEDGTPKEAVNDKGETIPNTVQIPNDKLDLLNKDMNEVMNSEVEVHNVQFKITDFPENLEIEPSLLLALAPLLVTEE